jgi:N-methylhydantoinase A/oxoprolinase/acetone carboxylase beta subunit
MKSFYRIGIDIGGTNTDAVLVDADKRIVAAVKMGTTEDIVTGFSKALKSLLQISGVDPAAVRALLLGTTHATNAILQKKGLYRVGVIRLAGHNPESLPPCFGWPQDLKTAVFASYCNVGGGYECDGRLITPLCRQEVELAVQTLLEKGAESIAVVGTFSPQNSGQEVEVGKWIASIAGHDFPLSLSHEMGGIGFIERENSTILNSALKRFMAEGFQELQRACHQVGLDCPLCVTQNNGTVITLAHALNYPVLTISAGPTNSFTGASFLTGLSDAFIVDIGGTSTDIGLIRNGFLRRSLNTSCIGGVPLNFPMPDVLSIALGGGSRIELSSSLPTIGPDSVAKEILSLAQCFGGKTLTLTDAAVARGIPLPGASPERIGCDLAQAVDILKEAVRKIAAAICLLGAGKELPIILVGGGAQLLSCELPEERYLIPAHADVANAYGAALAGISGTIDRVVSLTEQESVLAQLQEEAVELAARAGADRCSVRIADIQIIPYHYMPNQVARVIVTAAGEQSENLP